MCQRGAWLGSEEANIPVFSAGTREAAFVHALAAAAVAQSIARSCASGELPRCSCGPAPAEPPAPGSRWGGCGDNLSHGLQLGAAFTDGSARAASGAAPGLRAVNRHNGAVGRAVGAGPPGMRVGMGGAEPTRGAAVWGGVCEPPGTGRG